MKENLQMLWLNLSCPVEVKESHQTQSRSEGSPRMGYWVPVRDGPGLAPEWKSCLDAATAIGRGLAERCVQLIRVASPRERRDAWRV